MNLIKRHGPARRRSRLNPCKVVRKIYATVRFQIGHRSCNGIERIEAIDFREKKCLVCTNDDHCYGLEQMRDNSKEKSSTEGELILSLIGKGFYHESRCCSVAVLLNCANTSISSSASTAEPRRVLVNQQFVDRSTYECHSPHPRFLHRNTGGTVRDIYFPSIYTNRILSSDLRE